MIEEIISSNVFLIGYLSTIGVSAITYFASTIPINIRVIKENKGKKLKLFQLR